MTMTTPEEKAFYWALVYGEEQEPTIVLFEDDVFWLIGCDFSVAAKAVKIISKIEPPTT